MKLLSCNANRPLAEAIADYLDTRLTRSEVKTFSDQEIFVRIDENVRGEDVFVIQSTSYPANDNLMQLLICMDALKRASARRITAVIPYFGYARQDRRPRSSRVPISAKVVADMLGECGADRVLTVDLHADQIQGFFDIPVDNVYASPVLLGDIWRQKYENLIVVSPDVGGVVRARAVAKRLDDADLAIIDKRRPRANESRVMNIIGDVNGRSCVLVDDMADTAGTLCKAAAALKEHGAIRVVAYVTPPILSGPAITNITNSELDQLVVTDTIPLSPEAAASITSGANSASAPGPAVAPKATMRAGVSSNRCQSAVVRALAIARPSLTSRQRSSTERPSQAPEAWSPSRSPQPPKCRRLSPRRTATKDPVPTAATAPSRSPSAPAAVVGRSSVTVIRSQGIAAASVAACAASMIPASPRCATQDASPAGSSPASCAAAAMAARRLRTVASGSEV